MNKGLINAERGDGMKSPKPGYETAKQRLLDQVPLNGNRSLNRLWQYHADDFEGELFWQAARELEEEGKIVVRRHGDYAGARRRDLDAETCKRLTREYQKKYKRNLTPYQLPNRRVTPAEEKRP